MVFRSLLLTCVCLSVAGCNSGGDQGVPPTLSAMDDLQRSQIEDFNRELEKARQMPPPEIASTDGIPESGTFQVEFTTTAGRFVVEVNRAWAPIGADRFYNLVQDGFFDDSSFFRVVPGFVVQFGLAADPAMTEQWKTNLMDEPVKEKNRRGTLTFAKSGAPNSRTTQLFINLGDNSGSLDPQGFSPFGRVIEGMDAVDRISSDHGEEPDQGAITKSGNAYLSSKFPNLTYIQTARVLEDAAAAE